MLIPQEKIYTLLVLSAQNKRTTSQNGRVLSSSRTRAKPQSKRFEFLRSQLPGPLQFRGGSLGSTHGGRVGAGPGGPHREGLGRGWAGPCWAGPGRPGVGGARRARAGRGLAAEAVQEAREIWTSSGRWYPHSGFLRGVCNQRATAPAGRWWKDPVVL